MTTPDEKAAGEAERTPISFPDWAKVLERAPLSVVQRRAYWAEIVGFLTELWR